MIGKPFSPARSIAMLAAWLLWIWVLPSLVQAAEPPLKVGVTGSGPFVSLDSSPPSGAAVDVWNEVAALNQWTFTLVPFQDIQAGLEAAANGTVDILIGDLPITHSGLEKVEFSQPFFHSGLQILVPNEKKTLALGFFRELWGLSHLRIFWALVGCGALFTAVVYWFERKHNPDFPKGRGEGWAEAIYYVATLTLTGKSAYKGFPGILGRLVMIVWILIGIVVVAYVTSTITTAMTIEKLKGEIRGPDDLKGKCVAVVENSAGQACMRSRGISHLSFPTLFDAADSMLAGRADAVVDDVADVETMDFKRPEIPVGVVGPVFERVNYGFALAIGSPLRLPLNRALVSSAENGDLDRIFVGYFGSDHNQ